jgi:hypothetical protein
MSGLTREISPRRLSDNPRNPSSLMGEGKGGGGEDGEYPLASPFPPPLYPLPQGEGKPIGGQPPRRPLRKRGNTENTRASPFVKRLDLSSPKVRTGGGFWDSAQTSEKWGFTRNFPGNPHLLKVARET